MGDVWDLLPRRAEEALLPKLPIPLRYRSALEEEGARLGQGAGVGEAQDPAAPSRTLADQDPAQSAQGANLQADTPPEGQSRSAGEGRKRHQPRLAPGQVDAAGVTRPRLRSRPKSCAPHLRRGPSDLRAGR